MVHYLLWSCCHDAPVRWKPTGQIDWVPASDVASSTFSRVFAASDAFSRADAVGIHLQVEISRNDTVKEQAPGEIEQLRLAVEENVRSLLEQSLPEMTTALQHQQGAQQLSRRQISPNGLTSAKLYACGALTPGFLARSPCNLMAWKSADVGPLFRAADDPSSPSGALCFASSFPFPSAQTGSAQAFCAASSCELQAARSGLERSIWAAPRVLSEATQPRIASISVTNQGEHVRVDFSQIHASQTASHRMKIADTSPESGVVLISSIRQVQQVFTVEYHAVSSTGDVSSGTTELSIATKTVTGSMAASISGEGFHRRMVLDLEISDARFCENEQSKVLLVFPLSHSLYADLDELRASCFVAGTLLVP